MDHPINRHRARARRVATCALLAAFWLVTAITSTTAAAAAGFTGTYTARVEGEAVTLVLEQDGQDVAGTLTTAEGVMDIEAEVRGGAGGGNTAVGLGSLRNVLIGSAGVRLVRTDAGVTFSMHETDDNDEPIGPALLTLDLAGQGARAPRPQPMPAEQAPAREEQPMAEEEDLSAELGLGGDGDADDAMPEAADIAVPAPAAPVPAADLPANAYVHPSGITIPLPERWTVRTMNGMTLLSPPDPATRMGEPMELYILTVGPTRGARTPTDAAIVNSMDTDMAQLAPFLRRQGQPSEIRTGGGDRPAGLVRWRGTNPAGIEIAAEARVLLTDDLLFGLVSLGEPQHLQKRQADVEQAFGRATVGQPARDRDLIGTWTAGKSESYTSGEFSFASESRTTLQFNPDGTCAMRETSRVAGGGPGVTGDTGDDGGQITRGTWFARDGQACVITPDGALTAEYRVSGAPGGRTLTVNMGEQTTTFRE